VGKWGDGFEEWGDDPGVCPQGLVSLLMPNSLAIKLAALLKSRMLETSFQFILHPFHSCINNAD